MKTKLIALLVCLSFAAFAAEQPVYLSNGGKTVSDTSDSVINRLKSEGWTIVPTPPEVVADETARAADKAERQQIKALMADIKDGKGTNAERLARIEKALHRLLKDSLR